MRHPALILILLLGVSQSKIYSQASDCEQTLSLAAAEFDAGRFYGLPGILKSCLDKGFSTEQKVRAYLLLTQAYLILDDPTAAENSYLQLLKADPEYIATPSHDPIDVYYLSKKFTSTAIFTPHFHAGANTSLPRTIHSVNTSSGVNELNVDKTFRIGFQAEADVDWNIDQRWSVSVGAAYSRKSFKSTYHDNNQGYQGTFIEKQDWVDIPILVKYSIDSGKFRPFAYAGLSANLLLNAKLSPDGRDYFLDPKINSQQVSQAPDQSITFMRNFFNRSIVIGGGYKYKVGKNFFYFDVRYMAGLNNIAKNGQFNPLLVQFQYQSDFFRLDNLSISVGYVKPLYDPRKKKKAVASLLEKIGLKKRKK
jgi:hypothetical protein